MGPQGHVLIARPFGAFFNSLLVESESQRVNHGIVCRHCSIGGGMAYLYRLILFFFFSLPAFASDYTLSDGYIYVTLTGSHNAAVGSSYSSSCSAFAARYNSLNSTSYSVQSSTPTQCTLTNPSIPHTFSAWTSREPSYGVYVACPAGQYYAPDLRSCHQTIPVSCPSAGVVFGEASATIATGSFPTSANAVDANGCVITVQCTMVVEYDGKRDCVGNASYTGETGSSSPSGLFSEEQIDKAKDGYCQGEVNGTTVYVPCSGVSQNTDTATTTNSDGSTSTTKTSTSCQDGKCTTTETTTTTDAQGNTTASGTTKTESQSDFCQSNPGHASCKAGSFGGSCEAGFKCDGDAIQCAMAKVQHENKCALTPAPNAGAAYFDALTEGMPNNPNSGTVTVGSSMFNTSNLLGASSCTLDKSITVWGSTINLPFSQVCTALAYMGTLLQAVGFLLGARIITRG